MGAFEEKLKRDLPRGVEGASERPAEARWLDGRGLSKGWNFRDSNGRAEGIFLGCWEGKLIGRTDDRHVLTVAGSRGGKGVSLIKPNLWFYDGSIVATDPKGELARETAAHRRKMGQRVVVLDPFGASGDTQAMGWNPLQEIDLAHHDAIDDVLSIAEAMVQVPDKGETHWAEAAQGLVQGLIIATKLLRDSDARNLCTMRDLLMLRHPLVLDLADAKKLSEAKALFFLMQQLAEDEGARHKEGPALQAARLALGIGVSYAAMVERELESVLSTARTQTRFLDSPALRAVLGKHSIHLAEIKREPTTLYLCLPAGRMATHAKWLRIVINMALAAFEDDFKPEIPVLMLLDEFPVLGHMRSLEMAAGQMAGFGVKLWTVVQDLPQLHRIYGNPGWQTFAGNAGILTFFANNDAETLRYISEAVGQRAMLVAQPSGATPGGRYAGASSQSETLRGEPLLSPAEVRIILDRDEKRLLVLTPRELPAIIERVIFHKEPELFGE